MGGGIHVAFGGAHGAIDSGTAQSVDEQMNDVIDGGAPMSVGEQMSDAGAGGSGGGALQGAIRKKTHRKHLQSGGARRAAAKARRRGAGGDAS